MDDDELTLERIVDSTGKKEKETRRDVRLNDRKGRCRLFVYLFLFFYFFPLRRFAFQGARTKREQWRKRGEE